MARVVARAISISLDGFGTGPDQTLEDPIAVGGDRLHRWIFETRFARQMLAEEGGSVGIDNDFLEKADQGVGATIMGRNMSARSAGPGPTTTGAAGGATTRLTTILYSS
jgi:hypothetical protein